MPCGECERCKQQPSRYNLCKGMRFRSSAKSVPHFQGTLQERINHPAEWCYKLPESVSLEVGALLEPLGVALHAVRRAQMPPDATVLVFGAGAVGLLCAAAAKLRGARHVIIADIDQGRVEFAVRHRFADSCYTVPMKRGNSSEEGLEIAKETARAVGEVLRGEGVDVEEVDAAFECTGVPPCVHASIYVSWDLRLELEARCEWYTDAVIGYKTGRLCHVGRDGHAGHDITVGCCSITGGGSKRCLPLREHISRGCRAGVTA